MAEKNEGPEKEPVTTGKNRHFTSLVVGAVVVFLLAVVVVVYQLHKSSSGPKSSAPQAPQMESQNIKLRTTPQYASEVASADAASLQRAAHSGQSYVPPPIVASGSAATKTGPSQLNLGFHAALPKRMPRRKAFSETPGGTHAVASGTAAARALRVKRISASIQAELQHVAGWQVPTAAKTILIAETGRAGRQARSPPAASANSAAKNKYPPGLKPGTVLYAVEDLSINSDSTSPVIATVAQGRYRNAKAIGSFKRKGDHLIVQFSKLVLPSGKSYSLSAYAVNPNTSSTDVRTDVDHHYLERWGGLIASAFLQGMGQAVAMQGQTTVTTGGSTIVTRPKLNVGQQAIIAAGQVGEKAGQVLQNGFNRPPTVYLAAGTGMGILILDFGGGGQ